MLEIKKKDVFYFILLCDFLRAIYWDNIQPAR